jgi:hypothetical protein
MATIETYTEITLDLLNEYGVSVLKKTYADINGVKTQIGTNHRKAYGNSPLGRESLTSELPEIYHNAVLTVWGETPVLEDPKNPNTVTDETESTEIVGDEEVTKGDE